MSTASVQPGDVLAGKYRVERVLGAGGMGYVVAARHLQLDQLVAMKFLRTGGVDNAEATTRFLREAKAVVKLRNEHVAKVFDVGTLETGEPYIVMEHLEGCDLAALTKQRHVLPHTEAVEYVIQACEALAEAHTIGIVHRDIKLANLFVTRGPAGGPLVKVLDFGISKTNPFGESEHDMTRTASMLGSPRFMSPEQMRDPRAVDGRSDIWSLGVVLYRLVAGHPPFEADTLGRLLTMVMHEPEPPLSAVRKDLPPGFEMAVARCLQKDPSHRYANVAELAQALVPFSADPAGARAAADRITAVLSLPHSATGGDLSIPITFDSNRGSHPPGASDTGTAAPWAGTHGGTRRGPTLGTVWLALVLAAILAGSAVFAKLRHDRQEAAAAADLAALQSAPATPQTQALPLPTQPAADLNEKRAPSPPSIGGAVSPLPPALGVAVRAPNLLPPGPTTTRTEPSARRTPPPAAGPRRPPAPTRPAAPPSPARGDEGIPTTRD
jgi:serine/threonine-protein kinase